MCSATKLPKYGGVLTILVTPPVQQGPKWDRRCRTRIRSGLERLQPAMTVFGAAVE